MIELVLHDRKQGLSHFFEIKCNGIKKLLANIILEIFPNDRSKVFGLLKSNLLITKLNSCVYRTDHE